MPSGEDDTDSLYAVLNVSRDASDDEIKKRYRYAIQDYRPYRDERAVRP